MASADASNFSTDPQVTGTSDPVTLSQKSGIAPFETLYSSFDLQAIPFYNFWEQDEEKTAKDRGNQDVDNLPRYVRLFWNRAPDLKDPLAVDKNKLGGAGVMPDCFYAYTQLSPFGFGSYQIVGASVEGVNFQPEHLQPDAFEQNAKQLANGHLFAGIVEAVVTADQNSTDSVPKTALLSEDDYLADHQISQGIPFNEMNAAFWRYQSSVYGTQQSGKNANLSTSAQALKESMFDGNFSVGTGLRGTNISVSSNNISLDGNTAVSNRPSPIQRMYELASIHENADNQSDASNDVSVKFIHTNFQGAVSKTKIEAVVTADQAENVIALSTVAGNLASFAASGLQHYEREISIPSFSSPDKLKPIEYIGYVLEKYEQQNGSFVLVDTFYIPGIEYDEYIDSKVKYGVVYRYRIRSILRWCRPQNIGVLGEDPTVTAPSSGSVNSISPNLVSYFGSEWGAKWAYAPVLDRRPPPPPDEFTVRPCSQGEHSEDKDFDMKPFIEVTMKLPYNPQMDINKMTLYRKLQDQYGMDLTGWVQIREFSEEKRSGNRHIYVSDTVHNRNDITGMKFTRTERDVQQDFIEFAPTNARYRDYSAGMFGKDNSYRYVYTGICHTRHGEDSTLSEQIGARLNPNWKKEGEYSVDFVSCAGVSKDFDVGIFGTYPERRLRSEVIFNGPGVYVGGQTRLAPRMLNSSRYIMRVESLDNGQYTDVPININIINQGVIQNETYVPDGSDFDIDPGPAGQSPSTGAYGGVNIG